MRKSRYASNFVTIMVGCQVVPQDENAGVLEIPRQQRPFFQLCGQSVASRPVSPSPMRFRCASTAARITGSSQVGNPYSLQAAARSDRISTKRGQSAACRRTWSASVGRAPGFAQTTVSHSRSGRSRCSSNPLSAPRE